VARTRRRSASAAPVNAQLRSQTFGYIESVDLRLIERALRSSLTANTGTQLVRIGHVESDHPEAEICVTIGDEVVVGTLLAHV
jgi:hypothetical protein